MTDPGPFGWFAVSWAWMTAAMMLPASSAVVLRVTRATSSTVPAAAILFVAAYLAVWMVSGLAGYAVVEMIRGLHAGALAWSSGGRYVAGAAVAAAGLYQLTARKRRWLERCTAPRLPSAGESLRVGTLLAGVEHGRCCVACCWTLMVALYALGMMSITWMSVITVLIAGERLLPRRTGARYVVAVVLVALGIAVVAAPASVPGLTVSSGAHAMSAMMH